MSNQLSLSNKKRTREEVKEYYKVLKHKGKKYISLADMKRTIYEEISALSEEELDFLHEYILSKLNRTNKVTTEFLPVWTAIVIAMICSFYNNNYINSIAIFILISLIFFVCHISEYGIEKTNYYNLLLELINKVEETRERTFNDTLSLSNEIKNE